VRKKKDSSVRLYSFVWVLFAALAIALTGSNSSVETPDEHLAAAPQESIQVTQEKPVEAPSESKNEQQQVALARDTEQLEPEPETTAKEQNEQVPKITASEEPEEEVLVVAAQEPEPQEELVVVSTQVPVAETSDVEAQPQPEAPVAQEEKPVLEVAAQEQLPAAQPVEEPALASPPEEPEEEVLVVAAEEPEPQEELVVAVAQTPENQEAAKQEPPPAIEEPDDAVLAAPTVVITEKKFSVHEGPVWQAMALALQNWENHPPITLASRRDGIISSTYEYANPEVEDIDKFAIRPTIEGGVWERGRWRFQIMVSEHDDGTRIDIDLVAEAYESAKTAAWHKCKSRGILEKMIFDDIEQRLDNWIKKEVLLPPELIF
jgi:hypothetical protein